MGIGPTVRKILDAGDGVPVHVRQLADLLSKHGKKQKANQDGVTDIDEFGHDVTTHGGNTKTTLWDSETSYPIAERGRISEIPDRTARGDNATIVGHRGRDGDDGGHLGAHRFFSDTPDSGIVPQAANLNRGAWRTMENEWGDWAEHGHVVDYEISLFPPGTKRPDRFDVSYSVTNPQGTELWSRSASFENEAGQAFDRVAKSDISSF